MRAVIYRLNTNSTPVKGMWTACYPLEGVLSSTLECYFDPACIELLVSNATAFTPLNATETSQFPPNTTVQDLINELMLEQWSFDVSPENYYTQCAPSKCTYSYAHRNDVLAITTTIIGLAGGLNTALRLIVPWLVQVILKLKRKFSLTAVDTSPTAMVWAEEATTPSKGIMSKCRTSNRENGSFRANRSCERYGNKLKATALDEPLGIRFFIKIIR